VETVLATAPFAGAAGVAAGRNQQRVNRQAAAHSAPVAGTTAEAAQRDGRAQGDAAPLPVDDEGQARQPYTTLSDSDMPSLMARARQTIQRAISAVRGSRQHTDSYELMPVGDAQVADAAKHGLDIAGYRHVIDGSALRHTMKNHGNAKVEQARGQVAITDADLESIPDILAAPDKTSYGLKNSIGRDLIVHMKKMNDGTTLYLEEIRTKRGTLALQSMRKYPLTTSAASIEKTLRPTSETLQGDARSVANNPASPSPSSELAAATRRLAELEVLAGMQPLDTAQIIERDRLAGQVAALTEAEESRQADASVQNAPGKSADSVFGPVYTHCAFDAAAYRRS